jgi:hypothetical protein
MNKELFDYLVANQSVWQQQYKHQQDEEHKEKRLKYMEIYNQTYVRPSRAKKDKSYYVLN